MAKVAKALIIPKTPKCADGLRSATGKHKIGSINIEGVVVESQEGAITSATLMNALCAICGEQVKNGCDYAPIRDRYLRNVTVKDEENPEGFTEKGYI